MHSKRVCETRMQQQRSRPETNVLRASPKMEKAASVSTCDIVMPRKLESGTRDVFMCSRRETGHARCLQTDAKHPTHTSDQGAATLIPTAQTRAAATGSQWSCLICVSQRFFRLGLLGKRTIHVPRLQWFVHCGTEYPGMSAPHAALSCYQTSPLRTTLQNTAVPAGEHTRCDDIRSRACGRHGD